MQQPPALQPGRAEVISRLQWAWSSSPLLDLELSGERILQEKLNPADQPFTAWEDACDRFLALYSERRTNRLGETFELLIRSCFESHPAVYQVVPNLLLPAGEIDLLFSFKEEPEVYHAIELAVKFYLFDGTITNPEQRWIGPNRRDTLFRKVRRIFEVQVPRAFSSEALAALHTHAPSARIASSHTWVRGELYAPADQVELARETLRLLPQLNPAVPLSECVSTEELARAHPEGLVNYPLNRWNWICEAGDLPTPLTQETLLPTDDLRAQMALTGNDGSRRRVFVTPEGWCGREPPG